MIANYHTHTYRCGHAVGHESQYAEQAAEKGLKILGFSDHTPYDFFDVGPRNRPMRMMPEELESMWLQLRLLRKSMRADWRYMQVSRRSIILNIFPGFSR